MNAHINEIINFLDSKFPQDISDLRSRGLEYNKILTPDLAGVTSKAIRIRAETTILALNRLKSELPELLRGAITRVEQAHEADNIVSYITIITAILTAVLLTIQSIPIYLTVSASIGTAISSIASFLSKRRNRTLFDKTPGAQASFLADAQLMVSQILTDLELYLDDDDPTDYTSSTEKLIERANNIFLEINKAQIELKNNLGVF